MLVPREFETSGHRYQIGTFDVRKQWLVAKRILAGLAALSREQDSAPASDAPAEPPPALDDDQRKLAVLVFIRQVLVEMGDSDSEFVMSQCLNVVRRFDENAAGGSWRPILASSNSVQLRDGDIGLDEMLSLVLQVVEHNLGNFLFGTGAA